MAIRSAACSYPGWLPLSRVVMVVRAEDVVNVMLEGADASDRFGIGAVDSHGAVHFIRYTRDNVAGMPGHGMGGVPWGRFRFRYFEGTVEWSDCASPPNEVKHAVDSYLDRRGYPVLRHDSIYARMEREQEESAE